jgi:hypothetical protein
MKFFWDAERGVYVDERGRTVTPEALRKIQAESESNHVVELVALAVAFAIWRQMSTPLGEAMTPEEIFALVDPAIAEKAQARVRALGPVSSREFQVRMAEQITLSHNVNAVLAAGGFAAMTFALWNYAAERTRNEQVFAVRLAAEINRGTVSPAQAINRTSQYAKATYPTFAGTTDKRERAKGTIEARRILDPRAEHCARDETRGTPGCPELVSEDYEPIEDVVAIGESTCRSNCRCWIEYRREAAQAAAAQVQTPEEQIEQAA